MTLFGDDEGRVHTRDPWTSRVAAVSVKRDTQRWRVLLALGRSGEAGCTDAEVGERLGIRETAAGTRRKELEEAGLCARTARTRLTRYGNPALVHVITEAGLRVLDGA